MTNIVMICKDRPRLTEQTLRTLYDNTPRGEFNLTVVDDGSGLETNLVLKRFEKQGAAIISAGRTFATGCVGALKNSGAHWSQVGFGRGDFLCFIDNDIAFFPNWLGDLAYCYNEDVTPNLILGGYRHPYHLPNAAGKLCTHRDRQFNVQYTDAVAGYLHFMTWATWDKFGPYDANAKGVCQSEDHAICRRVVEDGGLVGYVHPPVIANCGITNSEGKPAVGSEAFPRIPGLIYE